MLQEASEDPVFRSLVGDLTLVLTQNNTLMNETSERLNPQHDINNYTFISINDEVRPRLIDHLESLLVLTQAEKCNGLTVPSPIWINSRYSLTPNLDIVESSL